MEDDLPESTSRVSASTSGKVESSVSKESEVWEDVERETEDWEDVERGTEIWEYVERETEDWEDVERESEVAEILTFEQYATPEPQTSLEWSDWHLDPFLSNPHL